ncbi:MAG: succinyl-diaminopimelate desuccinylase [Hyphomicrobiaceae bacterium]
MTIDATDPVALTRALIQCESIAPADDGALGLLEEILTRAGFTCHRLVFSESGTYDVDNLYARIGTTAPNLCFAGHTDVVPPGDLAQWTHPPFAGEITDDILYGRGAVDMKGGVACFIAATLRHLAENDGKPASGSLSFLITGDEEADAINGTVKVLDWLKEKGEVLDACLVGEPSNPNALGDQMKIGRRGSANGQLVVHGKQGHVAYPQLADNPVPKLTKLIDHLASTPIDTGTDNFEPSNLQVTILSVPNTATNVIPAAATATFNIRYNDTWRRPTIEAWVHDQLAKAVKAEADNGNEISYNITFAGTGDVFLTEPGPLTQTLSNAVEAVTGRKPAPTTGGGTSDARFIKDACPVIEFGLVNASIHDIDEHVPVADLKVLTQIYQRFIADYFAATVPKT